jgi:hypothetical protein
MSLQLTSPDQVAALAPDASAVTAGKKLGNSSHWRSLGQNADALWGECQGSALYQVRVDLNTLTITCSCPSRKIPCKHGLGLLFLAVGSPSAILTGDAPEWVASWLAKRAAAQQRKAAAESMPDQIAVAPVKKSVGVTQAKRAEKREAQMLQGIERLDLWLNDLVYGGLASVETLPARFWEQQAAQMVDAQLPGIAARLRRMSAIPHASVDWPEKLLGELGRLALLSHAFSRREQFDAPLQADLRQLVGWTIDQEEAAVQGEVVADDWYILGQRVHVEEKLREQYTWLIGAQNRRAALILQFAFGQSPFPEALPPGVHQEGQMLFWPSAAPQRARFASRRGALLSISEPFPCIESIEGVMAQVAATLARQPWQERFLCTLNNVVPLYDTDAARWYLRDTAGAALPLARGEHWRLLALTGGHPAVVAGEWNGETLYPLGVLIDGAYYIL